MNTQTKTKSPTQTAQQITANDFRVDWQAQIDSDNLDKLVNQGFVVLDDVFHNNALLALQTESQGIEYQQATLTKGEQLTHIRGDKICWIHQNLVAGSHYLHSIHQLAKLCNQWLYTGISHSEAHYACYPAGFGYQWHKDNPRGRNERVLSAVFYLNNDWSIKDAGELSVIDLTDVHHRILPKANRLIVFNSDLQHQVEIANRQRHSIATWMRRD